MAATSETQQLQPPPYAGTSLLLNFSWKRFQILVTDESQPSDPTYRIGIHTTLGPHVILRSAKNGVTIGTGTLHAFSINPDLEIHGRNGRLQALKRFQTEYTHLSHAYSDAETPTALRWTSSSGFTAWDFTCTDEQGTAVAKFSANLLSATKVGKVDFIGPKASSRAAQEEILLAGVTLYYCMLSRTYNVLNIFGAIWNKPGPLDEGTKTSVSWTEFTHGAPDERQFRPTLNQT